jgi:phosphate transport system protein
MSAPIPKSPAATTPGQFLESTLHACDIARRAAVALAKGIAQGSPELTATVRKYEEELDTLDREINEGVTSSITGTTEEHARELLACLKFILELERIGDLLLNATNRLATAASRIHRQDAKDLSAMASVVATMLEDVQRAFADRDLERAIRVLKADAELDRLRNMMFIRHIENPEGEALREGFHVLSMTQSLERAGDHAKNLAEEICHLVSGRSVRHLLRQYDKPDEQVFVEQLRRKLAQKR